MHSTFCLHANFQSHPFVIDNQEEIHHLKNVLRLKSQQQITLYNGDGEEALGEILSLSSRQIKVKVLSVRKIPPLTPYTILACAIPKRSKFETIIEKATELGVSEIIPLQTQRTEIKIPLAKMENKIKRYSTVAINAVKQCKRATIPKIHPVMKFPAALKYLKEESTILMPSLLNSRENLIRKIQQIKKPEKLSVLIGPEGDFTEKEYAQAHKEGAIPITLGNTILKVETAAISTVACIHISFAENITF